MEIVMTNVFTELSVSEVFEVDGGKWHWWDALLILSIPGYGSVKLIYEDLNNCYQNGYAEGKALIK